MIGVENEDGTITAIYCHWNGDPNDNGSTLAKHYTDPAKINALMDLGNLSSLGHEIGNKHDDKAYRNDVCTAYMRDKEYDGDESAVVYPDRKGFDGEGIEDDGIEYFYLYSKGDWLMRHHKQKEYEILATVLEKLGVEAEPEVYVVQKIEHDIAGFESLGMRANHDGTMLTWRSNNPDIHPTIHANYFPNDSEPWLIAHPAYLGPMQRFATAQEATEHAKGLIERVTAEAEESSGQHEDDGPKP